MAEGKGRATGPQRRPRVAAPKAEPEVKRVVDERAEEDVRRDSYDRARQRMIGEARRLREAVEDLPEGDTMRAPPTDDQLGFISDSEKKLTMLRLQLEQLAGSI